MPHAHLFEPARLGPLELPNRLVMAPMTRTKAGADGIPSPLMTRYWAQRASAGLIIAEATTPNPVGQTYPHVPGIHRPDQVAGWRRVTEAADGGRAAAERLLAAGADLIAPGRSFVANPDLVERLCAGGH